MDEEISKSQKKRDADQLKKIGVELIALSLEKLDTLPLTDQLKQAILTAKKLKSHGAVRRQAQLIGKLMRAADHTDIIEKYEEILAEGSAKTAAFHEAEQWRDKLLHGGKEALTLYIDTVRPDDVQQLRQLIKKAIDDHTKERNTGASKALFRYIRSHLQ